MSRREDGRLDDELRPVRLTRGFTSHPAGSVLVEFGNTRVMCTASVTDGVPRWRKGSGLGWLTAEYAMLPAATHERSDRESVKGRVGGRTQELSRLVGRSLPALVLAGLVCIVTTMSLAVAREQWLEQQPAVPMQEGEMTLISAGFAYRTAGGALISEADAMALVPDDVAVLDEGQAQPVHSGVWLESHGYSLVQLGVTQATSLGWEMFDIAAFVAIAALALGASFLVVDRRRPT